MLDGKWDSAAISHEIFQAFAPLYQESAEATYESIRRRWTERPLAGRWATVDDNNVAWMAVRVPGTTVIFFKGLDRTAHVNGFIAGVRENATGDQAAEFNTFTVGMAQRMWALLPEEYWWNGQRMFITGHSLGGSVACCLRKIGRAHV